MAPMRLAVSRCLISFVQKSLWPFLLLRSSGPHETGTKFCLKRSWAGRLSYNRFMDSEEMIGLVLFGIFAGMAVYILGAFVL
jgi:hypothetical protein